MGNIPDETTQMNRRTFIKKATTLLCGGAVLSSLNMTAAFGTGLSQNPLKKPVLQSSFPDRKLIYIAIDGLHPAYLSLDRDGNPGGSDGNWLMPRLRQFLSSALWYPNAKCYLPAATDMNHLNALAGTNTAQTGIIGVWAQPIGWKPDGSPVIVHSHLNFARDQNGQHVDTLFHAWKRRWPNSKTFMISGKEWVAEMFRQPGSSSGVDIIVTGASYPPYLKSPERESFADPPTDRDARCDPESGRIGFFNKNELKSEGLFAHFSPSQVMNRMYSGQCSLLTLQMERFPDHFPHDRWIVDSALDIIDREKPDMSYILLAQCDDGGHCIGSGWDASEFIASSDTTKLPQDCIQKTAYTLVSARNPLIYREAALDVIRDVDVQFGRLMNGLYDQGILSKSTVILLSDHGAINHHYTQDFSSTDVMGILYRSGIISKDDIYAFSVSSYGVLYFRNKKKLVPEAVALLKSHKTLNPQTGMHECPWRVMDRNDMENGIDGVSLAGELYHEFYIKKDKERSMIWPDIILLAENGWQIPAYNGHIPNVGLKVPKWTPPFRVYNGGHGSVETLPIVAAISLPGGRSGVSDRELRIGDLAVTTASLFDLKLQSTTVGRDLSMDL